MRKLPALEGGDIVGCGDDRKVEMLAGGHDMRHNTGEKEDVDHGERRDMSSLGRRIKQMRLDMRERCRRFGLVPVKVVTLTQSRSARTVIVRVSKPSPTMRVSGTGGR